MRIVEPKVFLVGETKIVPEGLQAYLNHIGMPNWTTDAPTDAEKLVEVMSRICYRSFAPGLNPNVTRVREGNALHLKNIIESRHGSVMEHAYLNFIFTNVSRVFTHELITHRAGTAKSQESLRFVRLDDLGFWPPLVIRENEDVMEIMSDTFEHLEGLQIKLADMLQLDKLDFETKKKLTSAMRRIAPEGLTTTIGWSANFRAIRHAIELRSAPPAEEEIRLVFGKKVGDIVTGRYTNAFGDYSVEEVDGLPHYTTPNIKV